MTLTFEQHLWLNWGAIEEMWCLPFGRALRTIGPGLRSLGAWQNRSQTKILSMQENSGRHGFGIGSCR